MIRINSFNKRVSLKSSDIFKSFNFLSISSAMNEFVELCLNSIDKLTQSCLRILPPRDLNLFFFHPK